MIGAPVLLAIGLVPLLAAPSLTTDLIFFAVVGLTLGTYLSADQALMVAVLPNTDTAARDLGMLSIGSTLPAVVARSSAETFGLRTFPVLHASPV